MIRYTRIGERAWESLTETMSSKRGSSRTVREFRTSLESLEFHQYQLDQWQRSVLEELHLNHANLDDTRSTLLRTVLHLRANQMRSVMIRPFLYASTDIMVQQEKSDAAVDVAHDTIQTIADLHARSDMYRQQQALFNYFLVSALGVLYALIVREIKRDASLTTSVRLSLSSFAKAKSGFFGGLNVLQSLGASATYPRRLWNKLFPFIKQHEVLQNQDDRGLEPADCFVKSLPYFPNNSNCDSLGNYQNLQVDPALRVSHVSAMDSAPQPAIQVYPESDFNIWNIFDPGEPYSANDVLLDTHFEQQPMESFSDSTFAPSF